MSRRPLALALSILAVAACGSGDGGSGDETPTPCVPGPVTLTHVTTTAYACNEPFTTRVQLVNGGCTSARVTKLDIAAQVTSCSVATCIASCATPAGAATGLCSYPLDVFVTPKSTGTVLELGGDSYHYPAGGLSMVERYTYTATYQQGGATETVSAAPVDVTVTLPQPCP